MPGANHHNFTVQPYLRIIALYDKQFIPLTFQSLFTVHVLFRA